MWSWSRYHTRRRSEWYNFRLHWRISRPRLQLDNLMSRLSWHLRFSQLKCLHHLYSTWIGSDLAALCGDSWLNLNIHLNTPSVRLIRYRLDPGTLTTEPGTETILSQASCWFAEVGFVESSLTRWVSSALFPVCRSAGNHNSCSVRPSSHLRLHNHLLNI